MTTTVLNHTITTNTTTTNTTAVWGDTTRSRLAGNSDAAGA